MFMVTKILKPSCWMMGISKRQFTCMLREGCMLNADSLLKWYVHTRFLNSSMTIMLRTSKAGLLAELQIQFSSKEENELFHWKCFTLKMSFYWERELVVLLTSSLILSMERIKIYLIVTRSPCSQLAKCHSFVLWRLFLCVREVNVTDGLVGVRHVSPPEC